MRFAGENMQQIRLQRPVTEKQPSGQKVVTYQDADDDPNPWSRVRDVRGSENYQADKKTAVKVKFFQIHTRDDVDETWTVLDEEQNRRYDIVNIHPIGNRKLDIEAIWTQGQYNE